MKFRSAVEWVDGSLEVVDQRLLPGRFEIRKLGSAAEVVEAIAGLVVRGAPAIGACGAFGVVLGLDEGIPLDRLVSEIGDARPTAANLPWAVRRVARAARAAAPGEESAAALEEALAIWREDRESCRLIGEAGRVELSGVRHVLTHCNTGRLATCGIGTALGVVYAMAESGESVEVMATETRPVLQGARLTAWELTEAGIGVTLISDGASGAAMASGRVEAVLVSCDRVARNGDVANKVGTYVLAVLARSAGVPFYVAGPMSTFDASASGAADIPMEERPADEVLRVGGSQIAPEVAVWNPAFDVTPASLVTAFITDRGVLRPPFEETIARALDARQG